MSVWVDFVAVNETEIVRLRETIAMMEAGTFEMRSLEGGEWVVQNERWISEDRATITRLEALVARIKAEQGIA